MSKQRPTPDACTPLQVLPDGRVGFIDFGIVGRISEATWRGLEALLAALPAGDYATMARALGAMGATDSDVDYVSFARDLAAFFIDLDQLQGSLVVAAAGGGLSASLDLDQAAVNRLALELVRIGEAHGVRFPPDFGESQWLKAGCVGLGLQRLAHSSAAIADCKGVVLLMLANPLSNHACVLSPLLSRQASSSSKACTLTGEQSRSKCVVQAAPLYARSRTLVGHSSMCSMGSMQIPLQMFSMEPHCTICLATAQVCACAGSRATGAER